jgi:oligopeptide/dipeptide ABC transporter ATP-binding protein
LIADEAVSSLDVSIQAQILNLFEELKRRLSLTMVFISHQLAVVAHISDHVAIMYLGRVIEYGRASEVFARPAHPYTKGLLDAQPDPDPSFRRSEPAVRGELPSPVDIPTGCRFRTRCPFAEAICDESDPTLEMVGPARAVACHVLPFRDLTPPVSEIS